MKKKTAFAVIACIVLIVMFLIFWIIKLCIWLNGIPITESNGELALAITALLLAVLGMSLTL